MSFEYDKLAQPDGEIRIAVLQPGSFHDQLVIQFVRRNLEDATPVYQALSYVWGSEWCPIHAQVSSTRHSGTTSITQNLDSALRHLRNKKKPRSLWIDALCINQKDDEEKEVQVMKMGYIFESARSVIAWLGIEANNSSTAIVLLRDLGRSIHVDWSSLFISLRAHEGCGPVRRKGHDKLEIIEPTERIEDLPWRVEECRSVGIFLARPYFERAWIVQEVRLAKRVSFHCGFATLSEYDFWRAVASFYTCDMPEETGISKEEWGGTCWRVSLLMVLRARHGHISIYTLRDDLSRFICKDLRDKIYSILGILDPDSWCVQIQPTYAQTTEEVYTGIARRACTNWLDLDLLRDCELTSKVLDIPSWVPDWSTPPHSSTFLLKESACAWIEIPPIFDSSGLQCISQGISKGQIIELEDGYWDEMHASLEWTYDHIKALKRRVESITDPYITGQSPAEVYCRVLVADQFHELQQRFADLPVFTESFALLKRIWSGKGTEKMNDEDFLKLKNYLRESLFCLGRRRLFKTSDGYVGLAPYGAQQGDVLCVMLGCRVPIILRPAGDHTWLVVGHCYAHGLMKGEAIYHNEHVSRRDSAGRQSFPTLFNPQNGHSLYSARESLFMSGLEIEQKRNERLFVLPETLRAAGIPVEEFVLV